mmetsp:Transcript_9419/g.17111  ORF Transcript_9419/g.17111 Transcript_9419/m.17111 type:complete len:257 (-) Transcript_9419:1133-1903(-)
MERLRTLRASASPLSLTDSLTSSRALMATLQRRRSRTAAIVLNVDVLMKISSSSRIGPPPPSSFHDLPTITSAKAPQAPTRARHSLLDASSIKISIVGKRFSVIALRDSAPPPVTPSHKVFICSRVCLFGSWQARSIRGMSFDRCGRNASRISAEFVRLPMSENSPSNADALYRSRDPGLNQTGCEMDKRKRAYSTSDLPRARAEAAISRYAPKAASPSPAAPPTSVAVSIPKGSVIELASSTPDPWSLRCLLCVF